MGDFHSGHKTGLTSPSFHWHSDPDSDSGIRKAADIQRALWNPFAKAVKKYNFDVCIFNGDLIDGRGEGSGGTELITSDRLEQCDIAIDIINRVKAKRNLITYGTGYHSGKYEDFENIIARDTNADIDDQIFPKINGVVLDVKHHSGSTGVPHGVPTSIKRGQIWNMLYSQMELQPKSDIIIRSHIHRHYHVETGDGWVGMSLPALQGMGSKYGARRCEGTVDFGFVVLEIKPSGSLLWHKEISVVKAQAKKVIEV
jgi:hypothetical protein